MVKIICFPISSILDGYEKSGMALFKAREKYSVVIKMENDN